MTAGPCSSTTQKLLMTSQKTAPDAGFQNSGCCLRLSDLSTLLLTLLPAATAALGLCLQRRCAGAGAMGYPAILRPRDLGALPPAPVAPMLWAIGYPPASGPPRTTNITDAAGFRGPGSPTLPPASGSWLLRQKRLPHEQLHCLQLPVLRPQRAWECLKRDLAQISCDAPWTNEHYLVNSFACLAAWL